MLQRKAWLGLVPVGVLAFVACVGDPAAAPGAASGDGGSATEDSSTSQDGATQPDGVADGSGGDAADAEPPPCGYPGGGASWTAMASPTITPGASETNVTVSWSVLAGVAQTRP